MCRWVSYTGSPVYLEELIFHPEHSIIDQSLAARETTSTTNGDGFGIGWYDSRDVPGVYRDVKPAWNDTNLRSLAGQIRSHLFLAHVRAATGTPVQQTNCHPFRFGRWLFLHNGLIRDYRRVRRTVVCRVAPALFPNLCGSTDSEVMFHLALTFGLEDDPIGALEQMVGFVEQVGHDAGIEHPMQMTVGLTDGQNLHAVRYSTQRDSRSLYHSRDMRALKQLNPALERLADETTLVVSEPLNDVEAYWQGIPESTALTVSDGEVRTAAFTPRAP